MKAEIWTQEGCTLCEQVKETLGEGNYEEHPAALLCRFYHSYNLNTASRLLSFYKFLYTAMSTFARRWRRAGGFRASSFRECMGDCGGES